MEVGAGYSSAAEPFPSVQPEHPNSQSRSLPPIQEQLGSFITLTVLLAAVGCHLLGH